MLRVVVASLRTSKRVAGKISLATSHLGSGLREGDPGLSRTGTLPGPCEVGLDIGVVTEALLSVLVGEWVRLPREGSERFTRWWLASCRPTRSQDTSATRRVCWFLGCVPFSNCMTISRVRGFGSGCQERFRVSAEGKRAGPGVVMQLAQGRGWNALTLLPPGRRLCSRKDTRGLTESQE